MWASRHKRKSAKRRSWLFRLACSSCLLNSNFISSVVQQKLPKEAIFLWWLCDYGGTDDGSHTVTAYARCERKEALIRGKFYDLPEYLKVWLTKCFVMLLQNLDTHGFNLSSHLQLIESLKTDLTPQKVSQILDSAQKLVDEFATLKTQLVSYDYLRFSLTPYWWDSAVTRYLVELIQPAKTRE